MNPMIQPDRHPDAESLNAFAEHALRDPERARIVAHMAECARCRDVVYVAQSAAEADAAPLAGFKAEPRPGWIALALAKWRVALIPAAALAATGAVVLWVHLRPAPPRMEMAQVAPQPSAQVTAPAAARTADRSIPPPAPGPASASRFSAAGRPTEPEQRPEQEKAKPASPGFPAAGFSSTEEVARNAAVPTSSAPFGSARMAGGHHLDAYSAAMARQPAQPEQPNRPTQMDSEPALTNPLLLQQRTGKTSPAARSRAMPAEVPPAPAPPNMVAVHGVVVPLASGGPEPLTAQAIPAPTQLAPQPLNGFRVMPLARRAKLPSGLNTVSSATMLNQLLAVDSAGTVFLSQDAGKHWEPVRPQWSGKAIAVQAPAQGLYQLMPAARPESLDRASIATPPAEEKRAGPNVNATVSSPPPSPASAPLVTTTGAAPPIPAMLFKLVTDRHQTWVSADGKVWHEQ